MSKEVELRQLLAVARFALEQTTHSPTDLAGTDLKDARCHRGIPTAPFSGEFLTPQQCGRCSRELLARRVIVAINAEIGLPPPCFKELPVNLILKEIR